MEQEKLKPNLLPSATADSASLTRISLASSKRLVVSPAQQWWGEGHPHPRSTHSHTTWACSGSEVARRDLVLSPNSLLCTQEFHKPAKAPVQQGESYPLKKICFRQQAQRGGVLGLAKTRITPHTHICFSFWASWVSNRLATFSSAAFSGAFSTWACPIWGARKMSSPPQLLQSPSHLTSQRKARQ